MASRNVLTRRAQVVAVCVMVVWVLPGCGVLAPASQPVPPAAVPAPKPQPTAPDARPQVERSNTPPHQAHDNNTVERRESESNDMPRFESGLASWYGKAFHGRRTASGEIYDMHAMTAAHRTMPLPSYALVRNPANGREVVVKVNDRGPFIKGRVIDLSRAAARKLGIDGVAQVLVRRLTHDEIQSGSWKLPERVAKVP